MKSPPRLLVLSASVGAGHLSAAAAVEAALREADPQALVKNVDVLSLSTSAFRHVYGRVYLDLINHAPDVLGYMYEFLDQPRSSNKWMDRVRLAAERMNLAPFRDLLDSEKWDLIINTHFLPAELIAHLRRRRKISVPQFTVTTDFHTHRLWLNEPCERMFTATEEGADYLVTLGVERSRIEVTGIPVHPKFTRRPSRDECLKRHRLGGGRPVLLQLAGGFGVGPVEDIFRRLLDIQTPIELVVVAGRNEATRKRLAKVAVPSRHRAHVLGFSDKIDELMTAADLIVSKPGGLTTSEALACGTPLAIINPVPGQETLNSDFLLESGAAVRIHKTPLLAAKLERLLAEPQRMERLKNGARNAAHPFAARDVAAQALAFVSDGRARSE